MFTCNCGSTFTRADNLKRHQKSSCVLINNRVGETSRAVKRDACNADDPAAKKRCPLPSAVQPTNLIERCESCNVDVPVNQKHAHFRTLRHKANICVVHSDGVQLIKSAFNCRIASYRVRSDRKHIDYATFFDGIQQKVIKLLETVLTVHRSVKVNLELFATYVQHTQEVGDIKAFNTSNRVIDAAMDLNAVFEDFRDALTAQTTEFQEKDSGYKKIIDGVSGKFYSGHLSAIMGPSGAGKTSLLNILTGYQIAGTTGTIKCNSPSKRRKGVLQYRKESCYILQDDNLPLLFTVEECMMMACNLKIDNMNKKSKEFLINEILTNLGLYKAKKTRCQSLSGGQKKRVSIALELVDNPPIMFLDEPTTGLDSASTTQCVEMLKKLASGGRIIICTIHQPNAHTYEMFDQVYMMAKGRCVYQGPSTNTVPFLANVGLQCPQYHNPADYIMEIVSGEYGDYLDLLEKAAREDKWKYVPTIKIIGHPDIIDDEIIYATDNSSTKKTPPEWKRFFILLKRSSVQLYRDWTISQLKLLLHLLVGLFLGLAFQRCGRDATKVINNLGFLQVGILYLAYTSMMPAVLKFPSELVILKKENFNNWYKLTTYYAAFLVFDIPQQIMFSFVYCIGSYFISDQPLEADRFFKVLFVQVLSSLSSSGFGLILGTVTDPINGIFFGAVSLALMLSIGGFMLIFTHMSKVMYTLTYLSYVSYAVEGLMQAVYGFDRAALECPEDAEYCQYTSPELLLSDIGMSAPSYWKDILYLFCTFVLFRTIAFITLKRKLSTS